MRLRRWLQSRIPLILWGLLLLPASASAQGSDQKGEPYRPGDVVAVPEEADPDEDDEEEAEFRDPYGEASEGRHANQISSQVRYVLEGIVVSGNKRTKARIIRKFIPLKQGDFLDPESPDLVATEWRLMGTGWFNSVDIRLERGAQHGYVVLVVEVRERNTFVIEQLVAGLSEGRRENHRPGTQAFPLARLQDHRNQLGRARHPAFGHRASERVSAGRTRRPALPKAHQE